MWNSPDMTELFYYIDEFCSVFIPAWNKQLLKSGRKHRVKPSRMSASEVITIIIMFHHMRYRDFKTYYLTHVRLRWKREFPTLVSYSRFVELMQEYMLVLYAMAQAACVRSTGITFIDSTTLTVCHNKRIGSHKVFAGVASRGKTSMGWFYGFKLHLTISERGDLVSFTVTPGNVSDGNRSVMKRLTRELMGKLFGDKGYLSRTLSEWLMSRGIQLVTKIKRNMKNVLMPIVDKLLLRKRALIESVNDQLKNIYQIEHSRHRSPINFFVNLMAGLVAYKFAPRRPSLRFDRSIIQL